MALITLKFVTDIKDLDYEVVEFHGELDPSNLPDTEKQILEFLEKFTRRYLIFDFSNLKFINSEGIGFVVSCHMKLVKKNQELLVCGALPNVADVLTLIGLPKLIPTFRTAGEAIQFIKKQNS